MAIGDLRTVEYNRTRRGDIRALHLTDLHFTKGTFGDARDAVDFRHGLEAAIRTAHREASLDFVFVTGDLVDHSEWDQRTHEEVLTQARDYLHFLCHSVDIVPTKGLIVVPGNHDFKWKGLLRRSRSRREFEAVFGEFDVHRLYPEYGMVVGCFDSNDTRDWGELATGLVNLVSVDRLVEQLSALKTQPMRRIALVHHHPLPVPASEFLEQSKLIGRSINGAPEFMIMRNGGRLIQRLLRAQFQLVLHGHLHCRNYWGPVYGVGGGDNWMEVIAGVSLCANQENRHGFGVLTLADDGCLRYDEWGFDRQGSGVQRMGVPMVGYARVHERISQERARNAKFRASQYHKIYDIYQPEGDIVRTETYRGFTNVSGVAQSALELPMMADALTRQEFDAWIVGGGERIIVRRRVEMAGETATIRYRLEFEPPLQKDEDVTLVIRRKTVGGTFTSEELQRYWGLPDADLGWDRCSQTIWFPCDHFQLTMRFQNSFVDDSWTPEQVWLKVEDETSQEHTSEQAFAARLFYWHDPNELGLVGSANGADIAEASLSVPNPVTGFHYSICWRLPKSEPLDAAKRVKISRIRDRVLRLQTSRGGVEEFLAVCLQKVREVLELMFQRGVDDTRLQAALFGIDQSTVRGGEKDFRGASMICVAAQPRGCMLDGIELPWGRDVIGRAARQGLRVSVNRQELPDAVEVLHKLPQGIEIIIGEPLFCNSPDRYPAAVVALASSSKDSELTGIFDPASDGAKFVSSFIQGLWLANFPHLLQV